MKILWVSPFFLHPTDRGGQIRTLGTLKELHQTHEIDFVALNPPMNREGPQRSSEYSTRHFSIEHVAPKRGSVGMLPQLLWSQVSSVPLAVSRYASKSLKQKVEALTRENIYDCVVCDFLASAPNMPDLTECVLFQHNVESVIWERHAQNAQTFMQRTFFRSQAKKMAAYEGLVCRQAKQVIAVSDIDARRMEQMFDVQDVLSVRTGVDLEYFHASAAASLSSDLVFCGSMDWLPNVDAVEYFVGDILPLIRMECPQVRVTIAGRSPDTRVRRAVEGLSDVLVTGDVPDIRPYLWGSRVSVVPIRIGGGTRLKIYEAMAAGLPVVATSVGAEGLTYDDGRDLLIADTPATFAARCIALLTDEAARQKIAASALHLVTSQFSWEAVTKDFEAILLANRLSRQG